MDMIDSADLVMHAHHQTLTLLDTLIKLSPKALKIMMSFSSTFNCLSLIVITIIALVNFEAIN